MGVQLLQKGMNHIKNNNEKILNNTTKSNWCAIQYKAMTNYEIKKSIKYETYVFTWKEINKIYSKKEKLKILLLLSFVFLLVN